MRSILLLACVLAVAPASASLLEGLAGGAFAYQSDGGGHHDAPDSCATLLAHPDRFELLPGRAAEGVLVPPDDAADHYFLNVSDAQVGSRVAVQVAPAAAGTGIATDVAVPGCSGGSVFLPANHPALPHSPPAPGPAQKLVAPHNLHGSWSCDPSAWTFVLNHVGGITPPASIRATWSDGTQQDVPLAHLAGGSARYRTAHAAPFTLHNASALVPPQWSSQFNVGSAPCSVQDGGAVFGDPPERLGNAIRFTPVQPGLHILAVVPRADAPTVPTRLPASCHTSCLSSLLGGVDWIEYRAAWS